MGRQYAENHIRAFRKAAGLSMEELAARMNPEVTLATVAKLETRQMGLTLDYIIDIARIFEVPPQAIVTGPLDIQVVRAKQILVLNGPNLNRLGKREPHIYGTQTLADIGTMLQAHADGRATIDLRQSNHEGALVDWLHEAADTGVAAVLINPGAYTHTSIALLDAIKAIAPLPVFEVHLSDPMTREPFRHISYVGMAAAGHFAGHGAQSYVLALDAALAL
jgi:3-dehydroquinate dehydratase II